MNLRPLLLTLFVVGSLLVLFCGCGSDERPLSPPFDNEVIVKRVAAAPDTQDMNILDDPVWNQASEASILAGEDSVFTNFLGTRLLHIKAVSDGENLYLKFRWPDTTESKIPGRWYKQRCLGCAEWSQDLDTVKGYVEWERKRQLWENEDVLALLFDRVDNPINGAEGVNCAATCHADTNSSGYNHRPTGDGIDAWVWRAGRTNPMGLADDQFWRENERFDAFTRSLYVRNALSGNDVSDVKWMSKQGRDFQGNYLLAREATAFDISLDWQKNDGISGYIYDDEWATGPLKSRYDVRAKARHDGPIHRWTVVLWRKLQTTAPGEDVTFEAGKRYQVTAAIMDRTLRRHSGTGIFFLQF